MGFGSFYKKNPLVSFLVVEITCEPCHEEDSYDSNSYELSHVPLETHLEG